MSVSQELSNMRKAELQYQDCDSFKKIMEFYKERSAQYEQIMEKVNDQSPKLVAGLLYEFGAGVEDNILDAAAGTGCVGRQLKRLGYQNIHALEPSVEMANKAKASNIYSTFIECPLGENRCTVTKDSYDHATMNAGLAMNHIKPCGLRELCSAVKPGGLVVFNIREDYLHKVTMYNNLLQYMDKMESEGIWTKLSQKLLPYDAEYKAHYFVYKIK